MISFFIQIFGTYASQAHFRAALLNTFGENLKVSKEVVSQKNSNKSFCSLYGDSADFGIFHRSPHTLCVGSHPLGSCLQSYSKHW